LEYQSINRHIQRNRCANTARAISGCADKFMMCK
jgi:hypothetical protein